MLVLVIAMIVGDLVFVVGMCFCLQRIPLVFFVLSCA